MKETMPDISFERSMNHNYMVLSRCDFFGKGKNQDKDYRTRMLLENRIQGLLPVTHRQINGESRYYYEINSLQSLDRLYDKSEIRYDELKKLLSGCVSLFDRLEEYLLDGTQIIIKPQLIYIDVEKMEPYFVCYPEYEGDVRLSFMEFIDELLTKIDHTDERAVMLGYQVYRYTRNPNYVISEIGRMLEHVIVAMVQRESNTAYAPKELSEWNQPAYDAQGGARESAVHFAAQKMEDYGAYEYDYDAGSSYPHAEDGAGEEKEESGNRRTKSVGDLIGGIFCIIVSLCGGTVILGARMIQSVELSANNELYLCGAVGMAVMAAVLFFSCYLKKRKLEKEMELLGGSSGDCEDYEDYDAENTYYSEPRSFAPDIDSSENGSDSRYGKVQSDAYGSPRQDTYGSPRQDTYGSPRQDTYRGLYHSSCQSSGQSSYSETVCLGNEAVEERVLCGRVNGREINFSLDKLPVTVGKLANVADIVINDTAVSKMHARFEEHDGRVYVCDLNSTNGTVRNGVLLDVNQSVKLEPGDRLRFGRTCFTYC